MLPILLIEDTDEKLQISNFIIKAPVGGIRHAFKRYILPKPLATAQPAPRIVTMLTVRQRRFIKNNNRTQDNLKPLVLVR